MKRINVFVLLMVVFTLSLLAGCVATPYTTGSNSSWREDSYAPYNTQGDSYWWGGISEPRVLIRIPTLGVYFVPGLQVDVFFYGGYWWSSRSGNWYRASNYREPWEIVDRRYVPLPVYRVPRDYRARYGNQPHIPYGQWKKQWSVADPSWWGGVSEPQELIMMPNLGVYFVPGLQVDVFFYGGYWWSSREDHNWYRARNYHGPWEIVSSRYVPAPVYRAPKDYRDRYGNQPRIPYGQWKKQWQERDKKPGRGNNKE